MEVGATFGDVTPTRGPLQTVDRALQILLTFGDERQDWGVTELAEAFGWEPSTAQRLLATLAARGFLMSDPITRRYRLGPAVWAMSDLWVHNGLPRLAAPIITQLARDTGMTVVLAVPDGFHMRCVAAVEGEAGPLRSVSLIGDLYPGHAGATSRGYFAFLTPSQRRDMIRGRPVASFTPNTLTDPEAIEAAFRQAAQDGFAYSEGEFDANTIALAVPLLAVGRPLGSLSLSDRTGFHHGDLRRKLPQLQAAAEALTKLLVQGRAAS